MEKVRSCCCVVHTYLTCAERAVAFAAALPLMLADVMTRYNLVVPACRNIQCPDGNFWFQLDHISGLPADMCLTRKCHTAMVITTPLFDQPLE